MEPCSVSKSSASDRPCFASATLKLESSIPAALRRVGLSGRAGAGLDPCAALQCVVELAPGESRTDTLLLDLPGADFAWMLDGRPSAQLRVAGSHLAEGHR